MRKPSTVAVAMSLRRSARAEKTLAPSMPMKTHSVTSMVLLTWPMIEPRLALPSPLKSAEKTSILKATATMPMNSTIGAILATVTMVLTIAAWRTPAMIRKWMIHSRIDAPSTACHVLPSPKAGKK